MEFNIIHTEAKATVKNKFKRLAIISDCIHTLDENGTVNTENHVFCRQMDSLAQHFEHTVICCPFIKGVNSSASKYRSANIEFIQLPPVGGKRLKDKLVLLRTIPFWWKMFSVAFRKADIFYLRMPNNLNIPGFLYYHIKAARVFATYTGTWENYRNEPITYRVQKWILAHLFKGPVWVYSDKKPQKTNFFKNYSPSYSLNEWNQESEFVDRRIARRQDKPITNPVFITVGSLVPYKNQQYILEVCKQLCSDGLSFRWYIVGDGPLKGTYQKFVEENNLTGSVMITGKKTYCELTELYRESDFLVQSALIEGFGKTPMEAMLHGVIPVLSEVAMTNEMIGGGSRGYSYSVKKRENLTNLIYTMMHEQHKFAAMIQNGRHYAKQQTLEGWSQEYIQTINSFFEN